jgi:catalase
MAESPAEGRTGADEREVLTTRQGHPVHDNQNQRTVGSRGPATLENYQFLEKISHFDRERVPERVVHARGTAAFGYFEAYGTVGEEPVARYTRAATPPNSPATPAGSRSSSTPRTATGTSSATTSRCSSSATRSSSPT